MSGTEQNQACDRPGELPRHYDSAAAEARWIDEWERAGTYRFSGTASRERTFAIDTPPPTVSGSLHVGHVFSYTQTDVVARYQRMKGMDVFYPMGWDDNGLPTERRAQNYFNVTCDPTRPYRPGSDFAPVSGSSRRERATAVSRRTFIELCERLTAEDERAFMDLWRRVGLSVDWRHHYETIGPRARRAAQHSFLDLHRRGHVYSAVAPTMWDTDFQTAVAQAEIEDREEDSLFYDVEFAVDGTNERFAVATTRPELLAACVGVTAHPDDARYRGLFGRQALSPLFRLRVPIFPSTDVDPEKGTGILMVCTFGDATDVDWWRTQSLPLRPAIGPDGRLVDVAFGDECADPGRARSVYARLVGLPVRAARQATEELLRRRELSALGDRPALVGEPRRIRHAVKHYEKGRRPIEFISTRQWFVRLLDKRRSLVDAGDAVRWHPDHMRLRFRNWAEHLQFDWCISRQRYFGVAFPVWYPLDGDGRPRYESPILADPSSLPVDPMTDVPPGYRADDRDRPGGFTGETDVFDTWFTSSLTPQIVTGWPDEQENRSRLYPMDVRPQAHDIIRTWAFYTIVKSLLHEQTVPWRNALISGWILDPDRKKMSKSTGNVVTPTEYLERYTADGVRYWAASARLGADTAFDESMLKIGRRLVTKIYHAARLVLSLGEDAGAITNELDRAFVLGLARLADDAGSRLDSFDYAGALDAIETFFYSRFTDAFLELVKKRARSEDGGGATGTRSALAALRLGMDWLLRLFAPYLPFVTEELWRRLHAGVGDEGASVHRAPWPDASELAEVPEPESTRSLEVAAAALGAVHREKTLARRPLSAAVGRAVVRCDARTLEVLRLVVDDVASAAGVANLELHVDEDAHDATIGATLEFAPEAATGPGSAGASRDREP